MFASKGKRRRKNNQIPEFESTSALAMRYPNKYQAVKVSHHGYSFSSKLEASLYDMLRIMEMAEEIKDIQVQDHIHLTNARILYIPDFKVMDLKLNEPVWYEAKGFETDVWRIKRRLWLSYGPGRLRVFKGSAKSLQMTEELIPKK